MRLGTIHYISLLVFSGLVLFYPVFFHGFALDDGKQIVYNVAIHHIGSIPTFFTRSFLFAQGYKDITNYFYRPVFYSTYTLLYALGRGQPLPFHVLQVLLYIANAVLVFIFFRRIFSMQTAFLLALLFLVHPDNEEVAAYIANLQDCLFFFFGMCAVIRAQAIKKTSLFFYIVTWLLLLLSCLSKESGILFVIILPVFLFILHRERFKQYLFVSLATVLSYAALRLYASRAFLGTMLTAYTHGSSSFHDRTTMIPHVMAYELKDVLIPIPNLIVKNIFSTPTAYTYAVILFTLLGFIGCGILIRRIHAKMFAYFLFFSIWFWLGIIFHSQIIPLDVPIAKRWLYFSLIGALGIAGQLTQLYWQNIRTARYFLPVFYGLYLLFFTVETLQMNQYWIIIQEQHPITTYQSHSLR